MLSVVAFVLVVVSLFDGRLLCLSILFFGLACLPVLFCFFVLMECCFAGLVGVSAFCGTGAE